LFLLERYCSTLRCQVAIALEEEELRQAGRRRRRRRMTGAG
jgi:hypothetical protein